MGILLLGINLNCYNDGKITSPFSEKKESDKRVCGALYLYCQEQFNQCVDPPDNRDACSRNFQGCNNTVRGCILN